MNYRFIIALSLSIFLVFFFFFIQIFSAESLPEYLFHDCANTTLFTPNYTYESNLDALLSSLSSAAAANSTDGFANATAGQNPVDWAYGLFLCRGDLDATMCSECVTTGKQDILQRCPNQRISAIWYDQCMLRYSNRSIFSAMKQSPNRRFYNFGNVPEPTRFMQLLGETMNDVATRASAGVSGKKVAMAEVNFTSLQKLYGLAQCTPDLTTSDCRACLQFVIANLPQRKQRGISVTPSCNMRYELHSPAALAAPIPPPPALVTGPKGTGKSNNFMAIMVAVAIHVSEGMLLLSLACCFCRRKSTKMHTFIQGDQSGRIEMTNTESLQYDFATIRDATENFSPQNKLGAGAFGEVFKGTLSNGQQIAVKRKSPRRPQGVKEFENEVILLLKLQHRNLVQLLGYCSEDEEKLLVYEFMPRKSLDYYLFEPEKSKQLNWSTRYEIARGIARGMLYLHEDSQPQIIHRDLKPDNILLDREMNPKISDFGIARIFQVDQPWTETNKVMGTPGYIAPEYGLGRKFSVKSDIYSFGILLLELVIGKKNNSFDQEGEDIDIVIHAWKNWSGGTPLTVLDPAIGKPYSEDQVLRCLKIGLLCAQKNPNCRPTMADIVHELSSRPVTLDLPQKPVFFMSETERPTPGQLTGTLTILSNKEIAVAQV